MKIVAKTDIGNQRSENQDNYRAGKQQDGTVWALVCDGMGGTQGGKIASTVASEYMEMIFSQKIDEIKKPSEVKKFVIKTLKNINAAIYKKSEEDVQMQGMGTTVVCAVVRNNLVQYVHAGDSRAYLFTNGCLLQLTKDHSMVQELIDQGTITAEEAKIHPNKNLITRAIGVADTLDVDYGECVIKKGDILLLCTDGLTNFVSEEKIKQVLSKTSFEQTAEKLVSNALDNNGLDNITVLLVAAG